MDPLSDIMSKLKITNQKTIIFDLKKNTTALFPEYSGIKIYIAKSGSFFIKMDDRKQSYHVENGDLFIIGSGKSFSIFDVPNSPKTDVRNIQSQEDNLLYFSNGQCDFSFIGCRFLFKSDDTFRFIKNLPEPIIIKSEQEKNECIKFFVKQLSSEIEKPGLGSQLITEHLVQIILTQALRIFLDSGALKGGEGWLCAMADKNIGLALTSIHNQPGRKWRLDELANIAGMSRTAFTTKFRLLAGCSVIEYIRIWRFSLAIDRMVINKERISQIALDLGYESESAFSTAFKKSMGESPKRYIMNMT